MNFLMMVGLPGSGKSLFANEFAKTINAIVISSDAIRKELFGSEETQGDPKYVFEVMNKRTVDALKSGKNVIYDATNCSDKNRKNILQSISKFNCTKTAIVMATPIEQCKCNNLNRERKVPVNVIDNMYRNFHFPMYQEGFDNIFINYPFQDLLKDYNMSEKLLNKNDGLIYYNQNNSHHSQTLGNHLLSTCNYAIRNFKGNNMVSIAGLLHDIGKPEVCTMYDKRGNKTDEAHYYNHQYVSSYEAMFYLTDTSFKYFSNLEESDVVYICQLISNHMSPYFWEHEKTVERYRRYWGDSFYNDVMMLHEADVESHKDGVIPIVIKKTI